MRNEDPAKSPLCRLRILSGGLAADQPAHSRKPCRFLYNTRRERINTGTTSPVCTASPFSYLEI